MDVDAIEHMNADHAEVLVDYARFYGGASFDASNALLTPNTKMSELEIEYKCRDGSRRTCHVPITQPVTNLRSTLKKMAHEASLARIPPFRLVRPALGAPIIALLVLLGVSTHVANDDLRTWPFSLLFTSSAQASQILFGSVAVARCVFYVSVLIHVGEAVFCFRKLSALLKQDGRGKSRIWAWTLQTLLFGYASLAVLFEVMAPTGVHDDGTARKAKTT